MNRIDQDQSGSAFLCITQNWQQMDLADVRIFSPQDDRSAVQQVEQIVAVYRPEVGLLSGVARTGADISGFGSDGSELLEEVVRHQFHHSHRTAAAIMQDCCRAGFFSNLKHRASNAGQYLVPRGRLELVSLSDEGRRKSIGGILSLQKTAGALAEKTFCDGMVGISCQFCDTVVGDRRDDAARISAVTVACRQYRQLWG